MGLNVSKGNMYSFITHTWNTIKGKCEHDCSYCYMKNKGPLNPVRFDNKELKTDLGQRNYIFVGSSNDMFSKNTSELWINETLGHCLKHDMNQYMFQSKNPARFFDFKYPEETVFCTTIETNRWYPKIMQNAPKPQERSYAMNELKGHTSYVTIEPILDFDVDELFELIVMCKPNQVNIGADSCGHKMPEPSVEKIMMLIEMLKGFTKIHRKTNLKRLLK